MSSEAEDAVTGQDMVRLVPGYTSFFNVLADAALLIEGGTGRILDANVIALQTFGYSIDEMRLLRVDDLSAVEDGASVVPARLADASCGIDVPFEWQSRYKDGRLLWVDVQARGVLLEKQACVLAVLRDITARKAMEARLRIVHEALNDCGSSVAITDPGRSVVYLNAAFGLLFGYVEHQKGDIRLETLFADASQGETIIQAAAEGAEWQGEARMVSRIKGHFPAFVRATPVLGDDYDVDYMLFILNDITQVKQLEAQVFQSQNMKAIGQLAAGIAHEINTPTQYVGDNLDFLQKSFAELMQVIETSIDTVAKIRNGGTEERQWADFDACVARADVPYLREEVPLALRQSIEGISRVSEIVRAMRQFTHAGGGERKVADLNQAILNTVVVARNEWRYVADLETQLAPQLPPILCFPGEINQVLLNLIVNAAHAISDVVCPAGSLQVAPETKGRIVVSTRQDGNTIEIRVTDSGTGIPEDIRKRVFDPFFTTKEVGKGTGQGLAICHGVVVEHHHGSLTFETEVGKGTTFIVRLPIRNGSQT